MRPGGFRVEVPCRGNSDNFGYAYCVPRPDRGNIRSKGKDQSSIPKLNPLPLQDTGNGSSGPKCNACSGPLMEKTARCEAGCETKDKSNKLVAAPFGLRSGLRQSGSHLAASFYGTAEAVPLSKTGFFRSPYLVISL